MDLSHGENLWSDERTQMVLWSMTLTQGVINIQEFLNFALSPQTHISGYAINLTKELIDEHGRKQEKGNIAGLKEVK